MVKIDNEKNIERKINKSVELYYKNGISGIKKYFKDLNFTHNGNTLLHLYASANKSNKYSYLTIIAIITDLIYENVDYTIKNNDNKTFIDIGLECFGVEFVDELFDELTNKRFSELANLRNENDRSIMHEIIYRIEDFIDEYFSLWNLNDLYDCLIVCGYNASGAYGKEKYNILELLEQKLPKIIERLQEINNNKLNKKNKLFSKNKNLNSTPLSSEDVTKAVNDDFANFKAIYYYANVSELSLLLTDDTNQNKQLIRSLFNHQTGFYNGHIKLLESCICEISNPDKSLLTIKRLLEVYKYQFDDFYSLIITTLNAKRDTNYLIKLINLFYEAGYDFNFETDENRRIILNKAHNNKFSILNFYVALTKKGYVNFENDTKYLIIHPQQIRTEGFKIMFKEEIVKNNLNSNDNIYNNKTINIFLDIIDNFKETIAINNDYEFIQFFINLLVEEQKNVINSGDNILNEEIILNILKTLISKLTIENVNKIYLKHR